MCEISGYRSGVVDVFALLWCYIVYVGKQVQHWFRNLPEEQMLLIKYITMDISVGHCRIWKTFWTLKKQITGIIRLYNQLLLASISVMQWSVTRHVAFWHPVGSSVVLRIGLHLMFLNKVIPSGLCWTATWKNSLFLVQYHEYVVHYLSDFSCFGLFSVVLRPLHVIYRINVTAACVWWSLLVCVMMLKRNIVNLAIDCCGRLLTKAMWRNLN